MIRTICPMGFSRQDSVAYLAAQLAKGFSLALQRRTAELGFSPGQFPVLLELWKEDRLTQRQLLDRVDIEQATLANTLARMQRDGLVEPGEGCVAARPPRWRPPGPRSG